VCFSIKLNTIRCRISKSLEDCQVSDEEYKLILEEIEKYRSMKEQIWRKNVPTIGSVVDEQEGNYANRRSPHS